MGSRKLMEGSSVIGCAEIMLTGSWNMSFTLVLKASDSRLPYMEVRVNSIAGAMPVSCSSLAIGASLTDCNYSCWLLSDIRCVQCTIGEV